jgi:hypothetical protein
MRHALRVTRKAVFLFAVLPQHGGVLGPKRYGLIPTCRMPVRKKSGSVTIALERPGASGDQGVALGLDCCQET